MAGIKGQAMANPSQLKSPVPTEAPSIPEGSALGDFTPEGSALANFDPNSVDSSLQGQAPSPDQQVQEVAQPFESPWYTSALPTVGGIVGGIAGAPGGPVTAVGGAALGGAAGQSFRDLIETQWLGKPLGTDPLREAKNIAESGAWEGAGQGLGLGIAKVGGKIVKAIAAPVSERMGSILKTTKDALEEPLTKLISMKGTPKNIEEAGNTVKTLLTGNITGKYQPFVKAYEQLDEVSKMQPLRDESRRTFTVGLKGWAQEKLAGDNYNMIKKFADSIDAAGNGYQLDDVLKQIGDAKRMAYKNQATRQADVLGQLEDKVMDFADDQVTKLAARIQSGKASPDEMMFLQQIMQQRQIVEADPTKYAKSLAKDYLSQKDLVRGEYGKFRGFLEDVADQTKIRVGKSPRAFIKAIEEVPPEKLVERMFDPKNVQSLRQMRSEMPQVFEEVSRTKVKQMVQASSPDGVLDLKAFRRQVYKLPEPTRKLLFSPDDLKTMNQVVDNPRFDRLKSLEMRGEGMIARWARDIAEVGRISGEQVGKSVTSGAGAGVRQVVGKGAMGLGQMFYPGISKPQEDQ